MSEILRFVLLSSSFIAHWLFFAAVMVIIFGFYGGSELWLLEGQPWRFWPLICVLSLTISIFYENKFVCLVAVWCIITTPNPEFRENPWIIWELWPVFFMLAAPAMCFEKLITGYTDIFPWKVPFLSGDSEVWDRFASTIDKSLITTVIMYPISEVVGAISDLFNALGDAVDKVGDFLSNLSFFGWILLILLLIIMFYIIRVGSIVTA